jgi:hypothetical protein
MAAAPSAVTRATHWPLFRNRRLNGEGQLTSRQVSSLSSARALGMLTLNSCGGAYWQA